MNNFSEQQLAQMAQRGISMVQIEEQLRNFENGFPYIKLLKPATTADGISVTNSEDIARYVQKYQNRAESSKVIKFVPASGAASRMFKSLFEFYEKYKNHPEKADITENGSVREFFDLLSNFALYGDLTTMLAKYNKNVDQMLKNKLYIELLDAVLNEEGLNYGNLPKAILKFHQYNEHTRTALEEQLVEGYMYSRSGKKVYMHFTISEEHADLFKSLLKKVQSHYEEMFEVQYDISWSVQKKSTDTIAADEKNEPFLEEGKLIFRPGGHGALLENLNELNGDIVFIKNIDNVVPDRIKGETVTYKEVLAGVLIELQSQIFSYLEQMEDTASVDKNKIEELMHFAKQLNIVVPEQVLEAGNQTVFKFLQEKFNRPIRVCGMVKNTGEPGGGPFWVEKNGIRSLQIVESSQVDMDNKEQKELFMKATHFNPVDLVCGIKDYKGRKFDLLRYRDSNTGFISVKSKGGKALKAQELPGLWNGAMAEWITVFVEVPEITFNPVKTINDLLRNEHIK